MALSLETLLKVLMAWRGWALLGTGWERKGLWVGGVPQDPQGSVYRGIGRGVVRETWPQAESQGRGEAGVVLHSPWGLCPCPEGVLGLCLKAHPHIMTR